jgi:hypothetical protein
MKKLLFVLFSVLLLVPGLMAQNVGINDDNSSPNSSAMLDVNSTTKGLLVPRVALTGTSSASPVTTPATSLVVYNTASTSDVTPGFYFWSGSAWIRVLGSADYTVNHILSVTGDYSLTKSYNLIFANGNTSTHAAALTLPQVTSANDGLEITVKNTGAAEDLITVSGYSGATIDGKSSIGLTRWTGRTFVASNANWVVKEQISMVDNVLDVGTGCSFTTIPEVLSFLALHMSAPTVIKLGGGDFAISAAQTINLPHPLTIEGSSFGMTTLTSTVSGAATFSCASECYFKFLSFSNTNTGSGSDGIVFSGGSTVYYEVKDCDFTGFYKQLRVTNNSEVWIFENDFTSPGRSGIEIEAGSATSGILKVSECDFYSSPYGINLTSGVSETVSVINCTFYNSSGNIGLNYDPSNFTTFNSIFFTNNAYNNTGTFISGFDFSLTSGRDAKAFVQNNAGMEDENPHCRITVLNNASTISTSSSSAYYKVSWNTGNQSLYTCKWDLTTTSASMRYLPTNKRDVVMWISGNVKNNSSTNKTVNIGVCKNGVSSTRYGETTVFLASTGQNYQWSTVVYMSDVSANDYFELFFNTTASTGENYTFSDLNWYTESR